MKIKKIYLKMFEEILPMFEEMSLGYLLHQMRCQNEMKMWEMRLFN